MSYKVTFEQKAGFLHAVITGTNSKENVLSYLADIIQECVARDCFRLLIEERLEGPRLNTTELYEIATQGQKLATGRRPVIAFVDVNAVGMTNMKFAEDVAVNRGSSVRVCQTVSDAIRWLAHLDNVGTQPDATHSNK
jgi:hypothetical protein